MISGSPGIGADILFYFFILTVLGRENNIFILSPAKVGQTIFTSMFWLSTVTGFGIDPQPLYNESHCQYQVMISTCLHNPDFISCL